VADGLGLLDLLMSLFDSSPDASDPDASAWNPIPIPSYRELLADHIRTQTSTVRSVVEHPLAMARGIPSIIGDTLSFLGTRYVAPHTSLNALPGFARTLRVMHLDLEGVRAVAHAHFATVNDVYLTVVSGGLRDLLLARGERVDGIELTASVPAALRTAQA